MQYSSARPHTALHRTAAVSTQTPHTVVMSNSKSTHPHFSRYYSYTHAAPLESFDVSIYIVDVTSLSSNAVTCGLSGVVGGGNHAVGGFQ